METFDTNRWSRGALAVILALVSAVSTETALAASEESSAPSSMMDQEFVLAIGGFFPRVQSTVTLTSPRGFGKEPTRRPRAR